MKSIEEMRNEIDSFCDSNEDCECCSRRNNYFCENYSSDSEKSNGIIPEWHKFFFPEQYFSNTPTIKDSGERREFESGAVRDMAAGKGDMVSLPNAAILRLSKHYEAGATKYGRWNYLKGLPVSSFMDSALRHLFKYLDGWDDEDHLAAAAFNVLGAMEMEAKHKELIDIPNREGKECFDYEGK